MGQEKKKTPPRGGKAYRQFTDSAELKVPPNSNALHRLVFRLIHDTGLSFDQVRNLLDRHFMDTRRGTKDARAGATQDTNNLIKGLGELNTTWLNFSKFMAALPIVRFELTLRCYWVWRQRVSEHTVAVVTRRSDKEANPDTELLFNRLVTKSAEEVAAEDAAKKPKFPPV